MAILARLSAGLVCLAILGAACGYFSAEKQSVPVTGREQLVSMTEEEQAALGAQAFEQVLAEEGGPVTSGPEVDMVGRVGRHIAAVADDPGYEWEFALVDSPLVNAFCLPGGKVVVYRGLLEVAGDDAGLAVVLAHEVAHAIAQHGAERALQHEVTDTIGGIIALGLAWVDPDQRAAVLALFGAGTQFGVLLPFNRDQESEADRIGLIYMARAGYDPRTALEFWGRMSEAQDGAEPLEYLSTHPSNERRIEDLERWMPDALREYEAAQHR